MNPILTGVLLTTGLRLIARRRRTSAAIGGVLIAIALTQRRKDTRP